MVGAEGGVGAVRGERGLVPGLEGGVSVGGGAGVGRVHYVDILMPGPTLLLTRLGDQVRTWHLLLPVPWLVGGGGGGAPLAPTE